MMLAFGPSFYPKSGGDDASDAGFPAAACNLKTSLSSSPSVVELRPGVYWLGI